MPYERMKFGVTPILKGGNIFTGSSDAIYLRNKYQLALDNAYAAFVNETHYMEERSSIAQDLLHKVHGLEKSIEYHLSEFKALETTLESLLEKDFGQEYLMWKEHTQGLSIKTTDGIAGNPTTILGASNSTPILKYLEKYPEQSSHPNIISTKQSLENKIREIRGEQVNYIKAVSYYNTEISTWGKETLKNTDMFATYNFILNEGANKLNSCRYRRSIFYKLASEKTKQSVNIDTLNHRITQFKNTLDLIKSQYSEYTQNKLKAINY